MSYNYKKKLKHDGTKLYDKIKELCSFYNATITKKNLFAWNNTDFKIILEIERIKK